MTSISKLYEPSPRLGHGAAAVRGRCYLWGGCVQDFSASERKKPLSAVEIFDPHLETWEEHPTTGVPPPGLYSGAGTSLLDSLYWFGGYDGSSYYNSLHRLDTTTLEWREIQPLNQADGPMRKAGCGMVSFLQDQLAVFGGHGIPTGPTQPGAMFTKDTNTTDGRGWSSELHVFNITEGKWSSPPTTGPRPPPCSGFSFTAINNHQAMFFGGRQPGCGGRLDDCCLLNFESMEWTKLEKPEGGPWPVERSSHAACCLNYGEEHPQLLVTGGMDKNHNTLQDAWILDVNSGRWRELTLPGDAQPRIWHTATALSLGPGRTRVTMFGGCPKFESGKTDDTQQKLAKTTVLEFESVELPPSSDGPSAREWVLVGVADSSQLGSTKRLAELVKIKRKSEHAHMREIEELKKQVRQIEDELASAQRQSRLALARAVRAEIEVDKVAALEQQLSQTKTNLEGQIQMKDQARIAAEQQLQQTKATLEHEIHMAEQQFNQEKASLQHEIQVRDGKISSLQQQIYQTEKFLEHHKLAAMSAQQQFSHRVKNLERQIEVTEQARVALEMQIQATDMEKAELEHSLHQKEEQIRAKDKEKVELEQQICQIKEHRPPEVTQVAEMQQEGSEYVTAHGAVPSVHQLLQASEEGRKKEEELRQVKEDHQVEISRIIHESTAKQQKVEFELKAQVSTKSEKINILQNQVDALQHDQDGLQQQLKEKDIQIASISSESRYKQNRIETLTADRQELTRQVQTLEAKLNEEKFFRDHYSQEVDQLRDELMDKIVENEYLTKQQKDVVTADTLLATSPAGGSDKMEVKDQNVQTNSLEMKDHNTQTEIVQIKDQQVQAESATQQQDEVELKDQQAKNETADQQVQAGETVHQQGGSDKMEVKDQNVQTNTLEMKDQNTQTEIVQINDQPVQAESTTQQQVGFREVEMKDQQIQTETVEPMEPHVETENMTQQQDEVELKDQQAKNETVDQQVQAGEIVHQQEYLRGFETFAETSFNITDSNSHSFEWQQYGLKLHIPEGAMPAELTECKIDIKVGLAGQFRIPDDLQLVSCIYWLSGPQKPFLKPVTLEVEHCASLQDSSQSESLQFVVAKCSQAELPYQFRVLEKGAFVPQSSYGSIQISQFSFFGITIFRRSSRLSHYYSALFYIQKGLNWWHVDFVMTLNLKGSWKAIEDNYSRLNAIFGPRFMVQFENDTIKLEISEGLKNGWTITPLIPPVIDKQQVRRFKPGQEVPYCQLEVKLDKDKKSIDLKHKVKLQGAKSPRDFFIVTCPPEECVERQKDVTNEQRKQFGGSEEDGALKKRSFSDAADTPVLSPVAADNAPSSGSTASSPRDSSSEKVRQEEPTALGIEDLADISSYLHPLDKTTVFNLGLVLSLNYNRLKTMMDSQTFLQDMLARWLEKVDQVLQTGVPTWKRLVEALKDPRVGQNGLASKIEQDKDYLREP